MLQDFLADVAHNLFKPLLLFFYAGFTIPILRVKFEFPKVLYQGLTIYLLLAIGWHGGEELAGLEPEMYAQAAGFMVVGFFANFIIGFLAFAALRWFTKLRSIDAATVAGYYGSDSAGTFVTCLGVLTAANIAYAPYMPVMLAVMEIPGCLVALFIVSKLRAKGMDALGNIPGEEGFSRFNRADGSKAAGAIDEELDQAQIMIPKEEEELIGSASTTGHVRRGSRDGARRPFQPKREQTQSRHQADLDVEDEISLRSDDSTDGDRIPNKAPLFSGALLHEVFLNPGIFLLFAGIAIGFISRLQGTKVIAANDMLFNDLFQGMLCLFLLEMGMTAAKKLKDLMAGGWQFIAFALIAPNVFATFGMVVAHCYGLAIGHPLEQGTYALFAVLCGAASYIALPAVQRMAIPEASPTLPLAASLGLTFSYNVTIGIPVYLMIADILISYFR